METKMELVNYDTEKEVSTVTISNEELVDINSVFWYISSTFSKQDETLLFGVDKLRLENMQSKIDIILDGIGKANALQK